MAKIEYSRITLSGEMSGAAFMQFVLYFHRTSKAGRRCAAARNDYSREKAG